MTRGNFIDTPFRSNMFTKQFELDMSIAVYVRIRRCDSILIRIKERYKNLRPIFFNKLYLICRNVQPLTNLNIYCDSNSKLRNAAHRKEKL